jgi:hypothetical protein
LSFFQDIEKEIGRITCGTERGTGFLVSDQLLITAEHVVKEHIDNKDVNITIEFPNLEDQQHEADIVSSDPSLDIAILRLRKPLTEIFGLSLICSRIPYNESWETYGFPVGKWNPGARVKGTVQRAHVRNQVTSWDMDLLLEQSLEQTEGLSGSPVIIDYAVQAIIIVRLDGTLGAISIKRLEDFLKRSGINYDVASQTDDLSEELRKSVEKSVQNSFVIDQLENHLLDQQNGYLALTGNPGSGKTTVVATFVPTSKEIEICGKYFIRSGENSVSVSYRASDFVFAEWIMTIIYRILYNDVPPKKERMLHDWIFEINQVFQKLSEYYAKKGGRGVIFVDGVDDLLHYGNINSFFSLLPERLPEHIVVVLSCQTKEVLPPFIRTQISNDQEIRLVPLAIHSCRYYVARETADLQLPYVLASMIAEKSEGHPLYLRYLVEYCKRFENVQDVDNWIKHVPVFEGEIGSYYESIWQSISNEEHEIWIMATLARIRQGVHLKTLEAMLPPEAQYALLTTLPKIQHLLTNNNTIEIYHSSFSVFVHVKTSLLDEKIHKAIGEFCIEQPQNSYSIKNAIFHFVHAGEELRRHAVSQCNQSWADLCATHHVEPDLMLQDLQNVLGISLESGNMVEVSKLLLLSQRIDFRYNHIFAAYATELADLLITTGKPKEAIGYLIRESVLIVTETEALRFLHRFYEVEAFDEAEMLYKAIRLRFEYEFIQEILSFRTLKMYYHALTISTAARADNPMSAFSKALTKLVKMYESADDEQNESYKLLIENIVAYNRSYLIWKKGIYIPIEHYEEQGIPFSDGITTLLSKMLIQMDHFKSWGTYAIDSSQFDRLLLDIQYVIDRYGVDEEDIPLILIALTDERISVETINSLIEKTDIGIDEQFKLRKSNGVDISFEDMNKYIDAWRFKGFLDKMDLYPRILPFDTLHWERYLESLLSFTGYALGKAWKAQTAGQEGVVSDVAAAFEKHLLSQLFVPFNQRVVWERSYALPESFYPFILKHVVSFYTRYCPDKLPQFIELVVDRASDQLGLYTEGFRAAIFAIIEELKTTGQHVRSMFKLLTILEDHILFGVQNRWERSVDLLRMADLYAIIGSNERSTRTFQNMLDTSLGPSWYKEDQLSLIGTAMLQLKCSATLPMHLKEIAGHLDYASGEMTFQRYVRHEKEEFIGKLCIIGRVKQAVEYYQDHVIPMPEKVLQRAEAKQLDYPEKGQGYVFGAGGLDEQNCILEIIESTPNIRGPLKWAFCELFLIGDDRYFSRFAAVMSGLFNQLETTGVDDLNYYKRLLRLFISDLSPVKRVEFLDHLHGYLTESNYKNIVNMLSRAGVIQEKSDETELGHTEIVNEQDVGTNFNKESSDRSDPREGELFLPGTFGKSSAMRQLDQLLDRAKEALEIENFQEAKKQIITGLENVQSGGWDIWSNRAGANVVAAFDMLVNLSNDVSEFIRLLRGLIEKEKYAPDWFIVNKLITCVGEKIVRQDAETLFLTVLEHFRLMLRTPDDFFQKYGWFESEALTQSNNMVLSQLLIGMMDHPNPIIHTRAPEIVKWVCRVEPSFFIPFLINVALLDGANNAPELCAGILHSLAIEDVELVWSYLQFEGILKRVSERKHFMVKYSFLEIVKLASVEHEDAVTFYENLLLTFSSSHSMLASEDVHQHPEWISGLDEWLHPLEQLGVISTYDYGDIAKCIVQLCNPLTREERLRADHYIARSFRLGSNARLYEKVDRCAINMYLANKVSRDYLSRVANVLRIYNPYFPDGKIRLESKTGLLSAIESIVSEESERYDVCTEEGDYYYLHYMETIYDPGVGRLNLVEIIGFLAGPNAFQYPFKNREIYDVFYSNEEPDFENGLTPTSLAYRPAIFKVVPLPSTVGGIKTPSFLHPHLEGFLNELQEEDVIRESWIEGRNWDVDRMGIALRNGCRTLISKKKLDVLKLTQWRLVWLVKYEGSSFVIDRDNQVIYPYE